MSEEASAEAGADCAANGSDGRLMRWDDDSFADVWQREVGSLRRLCVAILRSNRQDVDEAIGRTALRAIQYNGRPIENVGPWLRSIAQNVCMDLLRERRRRRHESFDVLSPRALGGEQMLDRRTPEVIYLESEHSRSLCRALDGLPAPLSRLVRLYYFEEFPLTRIAQLSGMSEANVRRKIRDAFDSIVAVLRDEAHVPRSGGAVRSFGVELPASVSAIQFVQLAAQGTERDIYWVLAEAPVRFSTRAIPHLQRYVEHHPAGWRKRLSLARLLRGRGALRQAIAHYKEVVLRRPAHVLAWLELVEAVAVADGPAAAATMRSAAAGSVTREAAPLFAVVGRGEKLEELAAAEDDNVYLWTLLAQESASAGHLEAAELAFDRALDIDPDNPVLLALSYDVLRAVGRDREARERLTAALIGDPSNAIALQRELVCRARVPREAKAHETAVLARRLHAVAGGAVETLYALAEHARACGGERRALAIAAELIRAHARNPAAWLRYADLCEAGLEACAVTAAQAVQRACELDGSNINAAVRLAHLTRGSAPAIVDSLTALAVLEWMADRPRAILEATHHLAQKNPSIPSIHLQRGRALRASDREAEALVELVTAYDLAVRRGSMRWAAEAALDVGSLHHGDSSCAWYRRALEAAGVLTADDPARASALTAHAVHALKTGDARP